MEEKGQGSLKLQTGGGGPCAEMSAHEMYAFSYHIIANNCEKNRQFLFRATRWLAQWRCLQGGCRTNSWMSRIPKRRRPLQRWCSCLWKESVWRKVGCCGMPHVGCLRRKWFYCICALHFASLSGPFVIPIWENDFFCSCYRRNSVNNLHDGFRHTNGHGLRTSGMTIKNSLIQHIDEGIKLSVTELFGHRTYIVFYYVSLVYV